MDSPCCLSPANLSDHFSVILSPPFIANDKTPQLLRETNDRRKRRSGTFLELIVVAEEQSRRKSLSLGIL
ncbi:hypothetical protein L1987_62835 [Smallanthus sonchifolius]|uniref:Uncharacterized protein n=1 Tax=Smallanthus sonchifolius TaxID=185202 RepID=A0ACB9CBM3_9ASTR|nr:hypothetical protein L1987_62835 [Smallanthus sonchifolius]